MIETFDILKISSKQNGYNTSKYAPNFEFPILTHLLWQPMTIKDKQWYTFEVLRVSSNQNGYNTLKHASNSRNPYYYPLKEAWVN